MPNYRDFWKPLEVLGTEGLLHVYLFKKKEKTFFKRFLPVNCILFFQKKALFDRWLTLEKSRAPGSITSSELRSLGHMTCGATASHILIVPHSVYA